VALSALRAPAGTDRVTVSDPLTIHLVHPGNPFSTDPDGIVSVQRNFVHAAPEDFDFLYWGVRRPGVEEPQEAERMRFRPVVSSISQRPRVPLSLRFAAGTLRARRHIDTGVLRFDRVESALPLLGSPLAKVLFLHIWDLADINGAHSDSRWRRLGWLYGRVLDAVVARMDRVYVLRPEVGHRLAGRVRGLEGKVRPFRVPVDASTFPFTTGRSRGEARAELFEQTGIPDEARVVVFAGRLEAVKRPGVVPEIARAMAADSRPVHFVIAGTGSLRKELERTAEAMSPGRVHFVGAWSQDRLASAFVAADACLLPSGFEALPNVVLESLACGTPVVASSSSGGVAGLLAGRDIGRLSSDTPAAFAESLNEVFAWEGTRAAACREAALEFTPQALNEGLYEELRTLAGQSVPVG
jgi:glycosyltransferase involved in cell wall biosynthesis